MVMMTMTTITKMFIKCKSNFYTVLLILLCCQNLVTEQIIYARGGGGFGINQYYNGGTGISSFKTGQNSMGFDRTGQNIEGQDRTGFNRDGNADIYDPLGSYSQERSDPRNNYSGWNRNGWYQQFGYSAYPWIGLNLGEYEFVGVGHKEDNSKK